MRYLCIISCEAAAFKGASNKTLHHQSRQRERKVGRRRKHHHTQHYYMGHKTRALNPSKDAHSLAVCCGFRPRRKCRVPSPPRGTPGLIAHPPGAGRHLGKGRVSRGAPVRSAVFKNYNSTPQPVPPRPTPQSTPVLHPRSCFTAACLTPAHSLTLTRHPSSVTNHPKAESSFIRTCWLAVDGAVLPGGGKIVNAL